MDQDHSDKLFRVRIAWRNVQGLWTENSGELFAPNAPVALQSFIASRALAPRNHWCEISVQAREPDALFAVRSELQGAQLRIDRLEAEIERLTMAE